MFKLKILNQAKKSGTLLYKAEQLFKEGNFLKEGSYSREETIKQNEVLIAESIQRRKVFKGGNYLRKYGTY